MAADILKIDIDAGWAGHGQLLFEVRGTVVDSGIEAKITDILSGVPAILTTRQPPIFPSCPTREPTGPLAAATARFCAGRCRQTQRTFASGCIRLLSHRR